MSSGQEEGNTKKWQSYANCGLSSDKVSAPLRGKEMRKLLLVQAEQVNEEIIYMDNRVICKQRQFYFFFPICIPLISFSGLSALARNSCTILKRSGDRGHSWHFLILMVKPVPNHYVGFPGNCMFLYISLSNQGSSTLFLVCWSNFILLHVDI